jgi:hypothetical protein
MNKSVRPPVHSFAARTGAQRLRRRLHGGSRPIPPPRLRSPEPPVRAMSLAELRALALGLNPHRAKAVFELALRARTEEEAVTVLGDLSRLPSRREDRVFHLVSLSWAAITGLLAAETKRSRHLAYDAFTQLSREDQKALLSYLKAPTIEEAHPRI